MWYHGLHVQTEHNSDETCDSNSWKKKKSPEHSICHTSKNVILILKLVCFSGLLEHK